MKALDSQDYWPTDNQLTPTVGPGIGELEDVQDADEELVRQVHESISSRPLIDASTLNEAPAKSDGSVAGLPPMDLPGFGSTYESNEGGKCGQPMPLACSGCGHTIEVGRTCRRSTCPRCGAAWVRDRAAQINARLGTVRAVRDANREEPQRYHHSIWIAPKDWYLDTEDELDETFRMLGEIYKALNHEAYIFYHPWSGSSYAQDDETLEDDRGKWRDRLFSGRDWRGDVADELNLRPHFHIVSVGHELPGGDFTASLYEEHGWIFKRALKKDSKVSLYDDEDLARAVTYILSHTAIDTTGQASRVQYRRYGSLLHSPDIEIKQKTKDHHDTLARRAAATTLGIPMADQFCLAETKGDTGETLQWGSNRSAIIAQAADDPERSDHEPLDHDVDELVDLVQEADIDWPAQLSIEGQLNTPAKLARDELESVAQELDLGDRDEELTECEGRLVHLLEARDLLDDEDWVDQAQHVDELQTTLEDWEGREEELIGWGPPVD